MLKAYEHIALGLIFPYDTLSDYSAFCRRLCTQRKPSSKEKAQPRTKRTEYAPPGSTPDVIVADDMASDSDESSEIEAVFEEAAELLAKQQRAEVHLSDHP